jgi:hypothetical protein
VLKISILDTPTRRRLVLEGKLIGPWAAELRSVCAKAKADLLGRELLVEVNNLTSISQEGENVLLELMSEGVAFQCRGVFTRHVLRQLAQRVRTNLRKTDV